MVLLFAGFQGILDLNGDSKSSIPMYEVRYPVVDGEIDLQSQCSEANIDSIVKLDACEHLINSEINIFSEYEFLLELMKWVSSWTDLGSGKTMAPENYWRNSVESNYISLQDNTFGLACGATAWLLMNVFNEFGYKSQIYNHGDEFGGSGATHVITLTQTKHNVFAFDAYLNTTFSDLNANNLDFRDVLGYLDNYEIDKIIVQGEPIYKEITILKNRNWAKSIQSAWPIKYGVGVDYSVQDCKVQSVRVTCPSFNVNYEKLLPWFIENYQVSEFLSKKDRNLLVRWENLLLFPIGLSSEKQGWQSLSGASHKDLVNVINERFRI